MQEPSTVNQSDMPANEPQYMLEVLEKDYFYIIKFIGDFNQIDYDQYLSQIFSLVDAPKDVICDCSRLKNLGPKWLQFILMVKNFLNLQKKKLRIVCLDNELKEKSNLSFDSNLYCKDLFETIYHFNYTIREKEKISFVKAIFLTLTRNMVTDYQTICFKEKIYMKKENLDEFANDISVFFKIEFVDFSIFFSFSFTIQICQRIIQFQSGEDIDEVNQENISFLIEFVKKIIVQAKEIFKDSHDAPQVQSLSLWPYKKYDPKNPIFNEMQKGLGVVIPFYCAIGNIDIEVILPTNYPLKDVFNAFFR